MPIADNVEYLGPELRTPQDNATSYDHNLHCQFSDSFGFRNTFSYRYFNDEYFLSEEIDFTPPSTLERDYLYFKHHRRPLMNIAELTGHFTKGLEQNLVVGWESQRYHNYTTLPKEDFFSATSIDVFNPVETQGPSDLTPDRDNVFTNTTNALYIQDHLTLGPRVKLLLGGRYDIYRRESHTDPIVNGVQTEGPVSKRNAEAFTSRAGLVYQPVRQVDLYGSFASSFTPLTLAQPDGSSLEPETGSQVEFGQRFHMAGDRLQLNTSVYRILRQNVPFRRPGNVYVQAGEVQSRGLSGPGDGAPRNGGSTRRTPLPTPSSRLPAVRDRQLRGTLRRSRQPSTSDAFDWQSGFVNVGGRCFRSHFADNANVFQIDGWPGQGVRYRRGSLGISSSSTTSRARACFRPTRLSRYLETVNVLRTVRVHLKSGRDQLIWGLGTRGAQPLGTTYL